MNEWGCRTDGWMDGWDAWLRFYLFPSSLHSGFMSDDEKLWLKDIVGMAGDI